MQFIGDVEANVRDDSRVANGSWDERVGSRPAFHLPKHRPSDDQLQPDFLQYLELQRGMSDQDSFERCTQLTWRVRYKHAEKQLCTYFC